MPLHNCPSCGLEVPEGEQSCFNCGHILDEQAIEQQFNEIPLNNETSVIETFSGDDESPTDTSTPTEDETTDESMRRGCLIAVGIACVLILILMMIITFILGTSR